MKLKIKYETINAATLVKVYVEDQLFDTLDVDIKGFATGKFFQERLSAREYKKIYPVLAEREGYLVITYKPRTINQCPSPTVVHDVICNGIVIDTVDKDDHNGEYSGRFPAYADEKLSEYRKNSYWAYVSLINKEYRGATNESIQAKKSLEPLATEVKQEAEAMFDGPVIVHSTKPSIDFNGYTLVVLVGKGSLEINFNQDKLANVKEGDTSLISSSFKFIITDPDIRYGKKDDVEYWNTIYVAGKLYDVNYSFDPFAHDIVYRTFSIYQVDTLSDGSYQLGSDSIIADEIIKRSSK